MRQKIWRKCRINLNNKIMSNEKYFIYKRKDRKVIRHELFQDKESAEQYLNNMKYAPNYAIAVATLRNDKLITATPGAFSVSELENKLKIKVA